MSAAVLREAADAIRGEWSPPHGTAWHRERDFHLAVADWLDRAADEPWCCDECKFDPENDLNLAHNALAVARAYLGSDQ